MTTEREYQEGQDRIRRAQGRREHLRSRSTKRGGNPFSFNRVPSTRSGNSPNKFVLWLLGGIVALAVIGNVLPRLREATEQVSPNQPSEQLR